MLVQQNLLSLLTSCQKIESLADIWRDPNAAVADRVEDLLNQLTVEEMIASLDANTFPTGAISRLGIPGFTGWNGMLQAPSHFDGIVVKRFLVYNRILLTLLYICSPCAPGEGKAEELASFDRGCEGACLWKHVQERKVAALLSLQNACMEVMIEVRQGMA